MAADSSGEVAGERGVSEVCVGGRIAEANTKTAERR